VTLDLKRTAAGGPFEQPHEIVGRREKMKKSIVVIGPQGCGKTLNAKALARVLNRPNWCELDQHPNPPREGHVILANDLTPATAGLKVMAFSEAIKLLDRPHPATPR
jgi:Mg-chelatase subunit ChlI